jgi:hypothetical protein
MLQPAVFAPDMLSRMPVLRAPLWVTIRRPEVFEKDLEQPEPLPGRTSGLGRSIEQRE